jgi:drug/metabolite transporter (DMT)-like permease
MKSYIVYALLAALLFGASTPFAKLLVGEMSPALLSGLLYLGSGIGLGISRLIRDKGWRASGLNLKDWLWFLAAILFGGILAPIFLMVGLQHTNGSTASLLLNMETVMTAMIAWLVFRENAGLRVVAGMIAIVSGSAVLSWSPELPDFRNWSGNVAVIIACCCWAIDNNLTRKISASDAVFIATGKGLIAGVFNFTMALILGASLPKPELILATATLGLFGYGISLTLFILALRGLGTARTSAYFSTAPFIGAVLALVILDEPATNNFWLTSLLMAAGVWLHITEKHEHEHTHESLLHEHPHYHDEHHQHHHNFEWDGKEPHKHVHLHTMITHKHPHYPDIHHQH